jgi:Predicted outer membrane protein
MKLSTKSGFSILAGLAFSIAYIGCTGASRERAADQAPNSAGYADRSTSSVSAADQEFAKKAAQGGMAEVELGRLAQRQGTSAHVKDFGKMLVEDHTKANNDLKDVAAKENITLPTDVSSEQRQNIDRLSKYSGAKFDREFLKDSVTDHREDISEFEKEANNGHDQALKSFASDKLPTLRKHLQMAEQHAR